MSYKTRSYKTRWYSKDWLAFVAEFLNARLKPVDKFTADELCDELPNGRHAAGGYGANIERKLLFRDVPVILVKAVLGNRLLTIDY